MKQWEIYLFPFEEEKPHPAVIISNDERGLNDLELRKCVNFTGKNSNREARKNEVILNGADGLDWKTAVRCDVIYLLPKAAFKELWAKLISPAG